MASSVSSVRQSVHSPNSSSRPTCPQPVPTYGILLSHLGIPPALRTSHISPASLASCLTWLANAHSRRPTRHVHRSLPGGSGLALQTRLVHFHSIGDWTDWDSQSLKLGGGSGHLHSIRPSLLISRLFSNYQSISLNHPPISLFCLSRLSIQVSLSPCPSPSCFFFSTSTPCQTYCISSEDLAMCCAIHLPSPKRPVDPIASPFPHRRICTHAHPEQRQT